MPGHSTVQVSLPPELEAFVESRLVSGRYQTSGQVVREALRLLAGTEIELDTALRELREKLELGAAEAKRGELIDGEQVFEELRLAIAEPDTQSGT